MPSFYKEIKEEIKSGKSYLSANFCFISENKVSTKIYHHFVKGKGTIMNIWTEKNLFLRKGQAKNVRI